MRECPPPETFLAAYFEYEPPSRDDDAETDDDGAVEVWECPLPDVTE